MTRDEQAHFVRELIANVQKDILANVPKMPEAWDGHELRRYIADKFEESVMTVGRKDHYGREHASRYRAYKNEVITRNL